jgi:hypothetical protein
VGDRHRNNFALSESTFLFEVRSIPLKVIPEPDQSVSVQFHFSDQKSLPNVSEFPLLQIVVLKLHLQDIQHLQTAE